MPSTTVIVSFPRTGTRIAKVIDLLRACGFTVKDGTSASRSHWYDLEAAGEDVSSLEKSLSVSGFEFDLKVA